MPASAQNFVYADTDGNIGYQAAGRLPIRQTCAGAAPVEDASCDWQGFIPFDKLPSAYNPQAGMIVGRRALIERINRNALKRALRVDKLRIAGLAAVLRLYANPDRLVQSLPLLRHLCRPPAEIEAQARRVLPALAQALAGQATVIIETAESQIGSGSLPADRLPSYALAVRPVAARREATARVEDLSRAFRALPLPVIGRVHDGVLTFDLRCLDEERDEDRLLQQLVHLAGHVKRH